METSISLHFLIVFDSENVSATKFVKLPEVSEVQMWRLPYVTNNFIVKNHPASIAPRILRQTTQPSQDYYSRVRSRMNRSSSIKFNSRSARAHSAIGIDVIHGRAGAVTIKVIDNVHSTRGYVAMVTYPFSHEKDIWRYITKTFLALKQSTFHCTGKQQVERRGTGSSKNRWERYLNILKGGIQ